MLRREVPIFLAMAVGWFMVADFFVPKFEAIGTEVQQFAVILTSCAAILGAANVARINLLKISRGDKDRFYAMVLLFGIVLMVLLGAGLTIIRDIFGIEEPWMVGSLTWHGVTDGSLFNRIYERAFVPLQATMFALLAFYIASAAFRAFRVRTLEATLLAIAAVIVMIGRVPLGNAIWDGIPQITDWIMNVPQLAAKRAILIGAALGAISTGLKILLGIERNYLGSD